MMVAAYQESVMGYDDARTKANIVPFGRKPTSQTLSDIKSFIDGYDGKKRELDNNAGTSRGESWTGERPRSDSNRRITDLQSVPLVHLGTRPRHLSHKTYEEFSTPISRNTRKSCRLGDCSPEHLTRRKVGGGIGVLNGPLDGGEHGVAGVGFAKITRRIPPCTA